MASWLVAKLPGGEMTGYRSTHYIIPTAGKSVTKQCNLHYTEVQLQFLHSLPYCTELSASTYDAK